MKTKLAIIIVALLLGGCSSNQLQLASSSIILADYGQTLRIASDPLHYEKNKIMGKNPSKTQVTAYFAGALLLHNVVGEHLEKHSSFWAKTYYWTVLVFESLVVNRNVNVGVKF